MRMINPLISGTAFSARTPPPAAAARTATTWCPSTVQLRPGRGRRRRHGHPGQVLRVPARRPFARSWCASWAARTRRSSTTRTCGGTKDRARGRERGLPLGPGPWPRPKRWRKRRAQHLQGLRRHHHGHRVLQSTPSDRLWFVQARPETRWNEDFEKHPGHHLHAPQGGGPQVRPGTDAELILEGNGASRGARARAR